MSFLGVLLLSYKLICMIGCLKVRCVFVLLGMLLGCVCMLWMICWMFRVWLWFVWLFRGVSCVGLGVSVCVFFLGFCLVSGVFLLIL